MLGFSASDRSASRDVAGLERADLSPWFNPFLLHFVRETWRSGGEVQVIRDGGEVTGLLVTDPIERVASAFSRSKPTAEMFVRARGPYAMYSDFPFEPSAEVFDIFSSSFGTEPPAYRFRHPIRPVTAGDIPSVLDLMREVYGATNERWFEGLPNASENGFVAKVDGRLAGVAWVTRVGPHARLHSLTVRAPYRRVGLGTDLLFARLVWAWQVGAHEVLSEISEHNEASQAIAVRGGMDRVGRIYFHRPL